MKKKFLPNLIFLLLINVLVKPFWVFGVEIGVQNEVGSENYGIYFALLNFAYMFQILLDFGIEYYNNRHIAQHNELLPKYLPNIIITKMVLGLLYFFILIMAAISLGDTGFEFHLLLFLGVNQIFISFIKYFRSNVSALHYFKTDSILSALDKVLMIGIVGYLLWFSGMDFKIEWLVYSQTLSFGITCLIALSITLILTKKLYFSIDLSTIKEVLKGSWPYAIGVFLMSIFNKLDGVMIKRMLTDGAMEAGIYASAFRLFDALNMVGLLFAGLLLPLFAKMIKEKENISGLLELGFKTIFTGGIILCVSSVFYRYDIMTLLYVEGDAYSGDIFGVLILSFLSVGSWYIFGTLLSANNNLKALNKLFIVCVGLNVLLNYLLIPEYKAMGAAIATLATQSIVIVVEMVLVKHYFNSAIKVITWLKIVALLVLVIVLNSYLPVVFELWWLNYLLILTISSIFALVLQLFDWRELSAALKR